MKCFLASFLTIDRIVFFIRGSCKTQQSGTNSMIAKPFPTPNDEALFGDPGFWFFANRHNLVALGDLQKIRNGAAPGAPKYRFDVLRRDSADLCPNGVLQFPHKNVMLDCGYRLDLVVENQVVVAIKSVSAVVGHEAQRLS
jgi:hypothetical protein